MIFYLFSETFTLNFAHVEKPFTQKNTLYTVHSTLTFDEQSLSLVQRTSPGKPPLPGFTLKCFHQQCLLTQNQTQKKVDPKANYFQILADMIFKQKIPFNIDLIPGKDLIIPLKEQGLKELHLEALHPFNPKTWKKISIYNQKGDLDRVYTITS